MTTEKQRLIFISYSRTNRGFAMELAQELKASGFRIWFDQLDIPTGSRWDDEIEKALTECEIFMVILTKQSIESHNVKDEVGYAIDSNKRILPILLEEVNVPFRLRRFQYVDFTNKSNNEGIDLAKQLLRTLMDETEEALSKTAAPKVPSREPEVDRSAEQQVDADRLARQRAEAVRKAREREHMERSSQAASPTPSLKRTPSQPKPLRQSSPKLLPIIAGVTLIAILCLGGGYAIWDCCIAPTDTPIPPTHTTITVTPSFTPIVPITTVAPPTTSAPTTPAPPVIPLKDPVQTIINYWNLRSNGEYTLAWGILSPNFQQKNHEGDLERYLASRNDDNYCKIETENVREISNDRRTAVVAITVKYYSGACPGTEAPWDFEVQLIFNDEKQVWLYDDTLKLTRAGNN